MGNGVRKCSSSNSVRRYSGKSATSSNDSGTNKNDDAEKRTKGHNCENQQLDLNSVQRQLIYDSWQNIDDKLDFVEHAFDFIFKSHPSLKSAFRLENEQYGNLKCSHFLDHLVRFDTFLTLIIESLINERDSDAAIFKSARQLGRDHSKLTVSVEYYNRSNFDLFVTSLVRSLEREQIRLGEEYPLTKMTKNILETWTTFLNQLFEIMLTAYLEKTTSR